MPGESGESVPLPIDSDEISRSIDSTHSFDYSDDEIAVNKSLYEIVRAAMEKYNVRPLYPGKEQGGFIYENFESRDSADGVTLEGYQSDEHSLRHLRQAYQLPDWFEAPMVVIHRGPVHPRDFLPDTRSWRDTPYNEPQQRVVVGADGRLYGFDNTVFINEKGEALVSRTVEAFSTAPSGSEDYEADTYELEGKVWPRVDFVPSPKDSDFAKISPSQRSLVPTYLRSIESGRFRPQRISPETKGVSAPLTPTSIEEEEEEWDSPEQIQREREKVWIEGFNKMGENARRAYEAQQKQPPSAAPHLQASERQSRRDLLRGKHLKPVASQKLQAPPTKAR